MSITILNRTYVITRKPADAHTHTHTHAHSHSRSRSRSSHHGPHLHGDRHTYYHRHHDGCAFVINRTGTTLRSDEVRGILNTSSLALRSRDRERLAIVWTYTGGLTVMKG